MVRRQGSSKLALLEAGDGAASFGWESMSTTTTAAGSIAGTTLIFFEPNGQRTMDVAAHPGVTEGAASDEASGTARELELDQPADSDSFVGRNQADEDVVMGPSQQINHMQPTMEEAELRAPMHDAQPEATEGPDAAEPVLPKGDADDSAKGEERAPEMGASDRDDDMDSAHEESHPENFGVEDGQDFVEPAKFEAAAVAAARRKKEAVKFPEGEPIIGTSDPIDDDASHSGGGSPNETVRETWPTISEPTCRVLVGEDAGSSDYGKSDHTCTACPDGCGVKNMQPPVYSVYSIDPPLDQLNAFELIMVVTWKSVMKVQPHASSGLYNKMKFIISHTDGKPFKGEMGPQVRGGGVSGAALGGKHIFEISDTEPPSVRGGLVEGRRLALASSPAPGDVGFCTRVCSNCANKPALVAIGETTGVRCEVSMAMDDGDGFIYRLKLVTGDAFSEYEGARYQGAEWQVLIRDVSNGNEVSVGRILLEGNTHSSGIEKFSNVHMHLGCTPCDAFYQGTVVGGPYITQPEGKHKVKACEVQALENMGTECNLRRAVGLGGMSVFLESGPGVWPTMAPNNTLFLCD